MWSPDAAARIICSHAVTEGGVTEGGSIWSRSAKPLEALGGERAFLSVLRAVLAFPGTSGRDVPTPERWTPVGAAACLKPGAKPRRTPAPREVEGGSALQVTTGGPGRHHILFNHQSRGFKPHREANTPHTPCLTRHVHP
ncbi:unnamed protein product [Lota lota]